MVSQLLSTMLLESKVIGQCSASSHNNLNTSSPQEGDYHTLGEVCLLWEVYPASQRGVSLNISNSCHIWIVVVWLRIYTRSLGRSGPICEAISVQLVARLVVLDHTMGQADLDYFVGLNSRFQGLRALDRLPSRT